MDDIQPQREDPEYWRAKAISALMLFGGGMHRSTAHRLLPMWRFYFQLRQADVDLVLDAFPNPAEPVSDR